MEESDVLGPDPSFHQQGVVQRHYLHQIATRLDHPADGVDQQLLDDAAHGRGDQGALDPVLQRPAGGIGLVQVGTRLV
ncbi:hypothetical protein D9M70_599840 [compost metagenome]